MNRNKFVEPFTEAQRKALETLRREDPLERTRRRAEAILLSGRGYSIDAISAILECHRVTVSRWIDQWQERGIDGLLEREGRGRKRCLTEAEQRQVMAWLDQEPRSARRLLGQIQRTFGKSLSLETVRRLIKRAGKVWKRMRTSLKGQRDETEFRACQKELAEQLEAARRGELALYFLDESGFHRTPSIPYAWQAPGVAERTLPCRTGKPINVIGLLAPTKPRIRLNMTTQAFTGTDVVAFLENFGQTVTQPTVVVMDNASIHTAKVVEDKRPEREAKGLYIYFLPTYSPELNLIEIFWHKVKYEWLPLDAYQSFTTLWEAVQDIFDGFGTKYYIEFT